MTLNNCDAIKLRRCIYCRGCGEEDLFHLIGRVDDSPNVNLSNIIGQEVEVKSYSGEERGKFLIIANDSSPRLGEHCFHLVGKLIDKGSTGGSI